MTVTTAPYLRLERRIVLQTSDLTAAGIDLRTLRGDPDLRALIHALRNVRDHAYRVAWRRETPNERQWRIAHDDAVHRLEIRVGLAAPDEWRGRVFPGYYDADPETDLSNLLAYRRAVRGGSL